MGAGKEKRMSKNKPDNTDLTDEIPVMVRQITPEEIMLELGIPCTQKSNADMLNHVPKRFVPLKEARERGLSWFFDGGSCRAGHIAAKRTSNPAICSDCERVKDGKTPIYGVTKGGPRQYNKKVVATDPNTASATPTAPAPSLGLDAADTRFLAAYAEHRDLDKAAKSVGTTVELVMARRVGHPGFNEALNKLEDSLQIARYMPLGAGFTWDDDKRRLFIEHYVNSGELDTARQAVGCTRAQYFNELKTNIQFASDVDAAKPLAESVIEEAFTRAAKAGQQSVLPKYFEILEARAKQRSDVPSDPTKMRAELQKTLNEIKARFDSERAWRVIATGTLIPYQQLEPVLRDTKTGTVYRKEELQDVAALLLNIERNAAARAADSTAVSSNDDLVTDETPEPDDEPGNT
jgi:hypothetical protein